MIGTIGLLVKESGNRGRWLLAATLYTVACVISATLLGLGLGVLGQWLGGAHAATSLPLGGAVVIGVLAMAYALSDLNVIAMPRPHVMQGVPITWWRWHGPYFAATAYGAALGLGVTTRMYFGAFYVLCAFCIVTGNPGYGAILMGTYGAARALMIFPSSWGVYRHRSSLQAVDAWLCSALFDVARAQRIMATVLVLFGTQVLLTGVLFQA